MLSVIPHFLEEMFNCLIRNILKAGQLYHPTMAVTGQPGRDCGRSGSGQNPTPVSQSAGQPGQPADRASREVVMDSKQID